MHNNYKNSPFGVIINLITFVTIMLTHFSNSTCMREVQGQTQLQHTCNISIVMPHAVSITTFG